MATNRRELLLALSLIPLPLSGGFLPRPAGLAALRGVLDDAVSAARVGAAFLAAERHTEAEILQALQKRLGGDAFAWQVLPPAALRRRVAAAVRDDFARGRTSSVRGWTLSLTEARLCALHALAS